MNEKLVREALEELKAKELVPKTKAIFLLEQALAPEPRFYRNQPVLAGDTEGTLIPHWIQSVDMLKAYRIVRPYLPAESLINWVEHDGNNKSPVQDDQLIVIQYRDGDVSGGKRLAGLRWTDTGNSRDIVRYAINPLPEFLD